MKQSRHNTHGFTLLELIIVIIVAAIFGSMIYTYSMSSRGAVDPVSVIKTRLALQKNMESIVAAYKARLAAGTLQLTSFKDDAGSLGTDGVSVDTAMVTLPPDTVPVLEITVSKEGQSLCSLFTQ